MGCAIVQSVLLDEFCTTEDNGLPAQFELVEEDLHLNDKDRAWITEQFGAVSKQLQSLAESTRPQGWRKLVFWLREWGLIATNITVMLSLFGLLLTAVYAVVHRDHDDAVFQTKTDARLSAIENSLGGIKLSSLASLPATSATPKQVAAIVQSGAEHPQKLDPLIVSSVGQKFVGESAANPDAWKAAAVLMQYKTALNAEYAPLRSDQIQYKNMVWQQSAGNVWSGRIGFLGAAREGTSEAADLEGMDVPRRVDIPRAPQYIVLEGGDLLLDELRMRHVVVFNAHVIYRGGRTDLSGVFFVHCTFEIDRGSKNSMMLADAVLAPEAVTDFAS